MPRLYFGANTLNVTVPPVSLPDWTLTLVSATPDGVVTYTVPYLPAGSYNKPDNVIVAYVPGSVLNPALTAEQVLALPGVSQVSTPFPAGFGPLNFDQTTSVNLPAPLPTGPVVVVIIGQFVA